ncbi:MAG: phospholipid carrier-dependent glycosyltransferase [Kiritimatiellae bacterium]|nr:phospholipid carrier-dependent glycosyltransferase [Kiritimatiellia bacterium]
MKKLIAGVLFVYLLIYVIPLGLRPIALIDEARYGEIPREMIAEGDWVSPRLNGLRYFEKPVLGYWMNAASMQLFGQNGFAIRLPSALAVGGTALLVFFLLRRATFSTGIALLGAAMQVTFAEVCVVGVTSVLDSMLTFFVTGMLTFFYLAYRSESVGWRVLHLLFCGVFAWLSFMTKGFLAFAVPVIAVVPFLLWQKDWKRLFTMPWIPLVTVALLILPWALAIHQREPDFWSYFFWEEHINRFVPESLSQPLHESAFWKDLLGEKVINRLVVRETQHEEPFWFFIPIMLGGAIPWVFALPAAFKGLFVTRKGEPLIRFAICWFVFPFLFFSASSGKLGTYILPCYPPLAILGGWGLCKYFGLGVRKAFNVGAWIMAGLFALVAVGLLVNYVTGWPEVVYQPSEWMKFALLLAGLCWLAGCAAAAARRPDYRAKLVLFALTPVLVLASAHVALPARLAVTESAQDFLRRHRERTEPALVAANKYLAHSACFFLERDDLYLFDSRGEFEYGLSYPDAKSRLMTVDGFDAMVRDPNRDKPLILLLDHEHYLEREEYFKTHEPSFVEVDGKLMILQYD